MPLGELDLSQGDFVLDGDPAPPPKNGAVPHFSVHVYCGQTDGWIKIPLGTEIGLGSGHVVLDGTHAAPRKRAQSPSIFGPCLLWPNGRPSQLLLNTCINLAP